MIEDKIVTPPIRTALVEENGRREPNAKTPSRDWWLHWNSITLRANQNAADIDKIETNVAGLRPDIDALRQKLNGLAQELDDLDVEVSRMLRSGTHAARLATAADPIGALWMETDRSDVIYQAQPSGSPVWAYIAGTMYGTLSPDQRPADLVASDAGFEFRSTDTDPVYGGRHFIWSEALWVEVTPARWGTHAARVAATPHPAGILWMETDRGNVVYQSHGVSGAAAWVYAVGTMWGTLSPDGRPSDLGGNDAGFLFETTDTLELYRWGGSAWENRTPANALQSATATTTLTLATFAQDIPGATLTLARPGVYLILGTFDFLMLGLDDSAICLGQLLVAGALQLGVATFHGSANAINMRATVFQQWLYQAATSGQVLQLQAYKTAGTGTTNVQQNHTKLSALWVRP